MNSSSLLARSSSRISTITLQLRSKFITSRSFSILSNSRFLGEARISKFPIVKRVQPTQFRRIRTISIGDTKERVHERSDYPIDKIRELFKNDTISIIGYGPQGRGQSLNAKDNKINVILGLREGGRSWKEALQDGWVPGKDLFNIEEALKKGTIVGNLLSDAAQKELWPQFVPHLTKGKTLYFSHGFSIVYKDQTHVVPPTDIDVIMIAPKGSGKTVRSHFLEGRGINSSFAVFQDISGKAEEKAIALGIAIGSGYLYETTFQREVFSDLVGERGVLMGAIQGLFLAQFEVLRARGHSPSEAFNETVEEATQSLYPLIGQNGMDWMYSNCSTTAQRGALDWYKPFRDAAKPVFEKLYSSVADGVETRLNQKVIIMTNECYYVYVL
ncbi:3982_t:CDS:2 [Diversispora eburnea]|uniref:ketol-acid reductoisomerase (NADP(+)) n=1 Tax=Diversispora eburnea TaxID=1213867 RepID=A0A9N9B2B9_9GLOM|nr:3982_t:CDS:2 [Diversispora eburnea]